MAPEQARGKPVDKRADIWAFGVVLYEILTGVRLFTGDEASDVLAAVLRQDVDWHALPAETPVSVRRLLGRCLERDPRRRLRDIGDAILDLELTAAPVVRLTDVAAPRRLSIPLIITAVVIAAVVAGTAAWVLKPAASTPSAPIVRASYPLGSPMWLTNPRPQLALSPDGQYVAAIVERGLTIRRVDQLTPTSIAGADGVVGVFFSPDSEWVGFWTNSAIKKSPIRGGGVQIVEETKEPMPGGPFGATWAADGVIYYATLGGIRGVPANGGSSRLMVQGANLGQPHALPGSRALLLVRGVSPAVLPDTAEIVLHPLDGGPTSF